MPERYRNYLGGEWVEAAAGQTYERHNPADTRELVGLFPSSGPEDVRRALEAAAGAQPKWAGLSGPERGKYLHKTADVLERRLEEVARGLTQEEGKTIGEARGEVARGVTILRYYAGEGSRQVGEVIPSANPRTLLFTTRAPLGVVALITPWNFPIAIPVWKLAPALVYGNTVVLKPATLAPLTALRVAECFAEAGLPPGVLNIVTGSGSGIGRELVTHAYTRAVSFTGSNSVGKTIAQWAMERGIKYQLEMGGKNPVIVLGDADLPQAVELTVSGAMRSTGQKCTATSRAIVLEGIAKKFTDMVVERIKSLKLGPGADEATYLGPLVSEEQRRTVLEYIAVGESEGARLLCGGKVPSDAMYSHGYYVEPTVFTEVTPQMRIAQEEIFGPVLAIMVAQSLDQAIALANHSRFGLSASICTRDLNAALEFASRIEAGMVRVNGETAGVEPQAPFGGFKASSSYSREQGRAALEFFTQVKTVSIDRAGK
ncbi:MAG: aldehyde dehydrogenase family protein [Deinococcus sp.]|nr:aldehyde dehydrogenase family protein [Deinococcus sp.]